MLPLFCAEILFSRPEILAVSAVFREFSICGTSGCLLPVCLFFLGAFLWAAVS